MCIKSLDSKRAFIGFARPVLTADSRAETFRGHFLDLRTLAHALSGESHRLSSACKAFGVEHCKAQTEDYGRITSEFIAYARRDVLATQELLERLRAQFDQLGIPLVPTKAFSPASIAKAAMHGMGVVPLHKKSPSITLLEIGRTMNAFYGGRAECRIRRVSVPVVTVDFRSMYPTVFCCMGLWSLVIAESVRFEDYTDEFRALLADATLSKAFSPQLWPKLAGFAEIEPDEDILPVRGQFSETREGWNIGVNPLTSCPPFTYAAPDVYASALLTGKSPRIRRAWRLVGHETQPGLRPIVLGGTIPIDPSSGDFFRTLIEERVRIKNSDDAFCDTDSMAIVATRFGGLVECEGGTADATDRIEAIRALTWRDVESIRALFSALNPYDASVIPSILNIEDVNFKDGAQREILAHVISAKRYALFTWDSCGSIKLDKCSEHGLGQLMSPIPKGADEKWPESLWSLILAEEHDIPHAYPEWLKYPAVARVCQHARMLSRILEAIQYDPIREARQTIWVLAALHRIPLWAP